MDRGPTVAIVLCAALLVPVAGAAGPDRGCRAPGEPSFDADTRKRLWEDDDLDADPAGGRVRVDAYRGGVHVTTWDRSAWRVEVAEHDPYDQLDADVELDAGNGSFRLQASVAPRDVPPELSPMRPDRAYAQIRVTVPDVAYQRVEVDNRPEIPGRIRVDGDAPEVAWDSVVVDDVDADEIRVDPYRDAIVGGVDAGVVDVATRTGSLDLTDVEADEVRYSAGSAGICVSDADVGTLDVSLTDGPVRIADADLRTARVSIQQGRLDVGEVRIGALDVSGNDVAFEADRLAARNISYGATGGTVDARLVPTASGTWSFDTGDARIDLSVPAGDDHGYDVEATGQRGRPVLDIPDLEVVESSATSVHARTVDYRDRDTRTRIEANGRHVRAEGDTATSGEGSVPIPPEAAGAGLVAAVVALAVVVLKAKGLLAPLYTRLSPDEVRDHAVRQQIVEIVADEPGIHFRELKRRVDAGRGILDHHLEKLVEVDLLDEARGDAYRCYFPAGEVDRRVMAVADRLRADGARAVLKALRERSSVSLTELADAAGLSSSTAGYHLDRLQDAGLLTRERRGGSLAVDLTDLGDLVLDQLEMS